MSTTSIQIHLINTVYTKYLNYSIKVMKAQTTFVRKVWSRLLNQSKLIRSTEDLSALITACRKKRSICAAQNVITAIGMFSCNDFEKKVFSKKLKVCSTAFWKDERSSILRNTAFGANQSIWYVWKQTTALMDKKFGKKKKFPKQTPNWRNNWCWMY